MPAEQSAPLPRQSIRGAGRQPQSWDSILRARKSIPDMRARSQEMLDLAQFCVRKAEGPGLRHGQRQRLLEKAQRLIEHSHTLRAEMRVQVERNRL